MMLGEHHRLNPTLHISPWSLIDDPTVDHVFNAKDFNLSDFSRYLPSNEPDPELESDSVIDAYTCEHFRMYEFKVRRCTRGRSHDWTECPYAHPGEKARRRDPRKYSYSGTGCPDYRKGVCKKGDSCEFAHGVFECWLHPTRYRTQPCKDGRSCRRRVCFFAHTPEQLRVLAESPPLSPRTESPPSQLSRSLGSMVASLRNLQLSKVKSLPCSRNNNMQVNINNSPGSPSGYGSASSGYGSPIGVSILRPGFSSLPTTPTWNLTRPNRFWDMVCEEEPVMERVESGRDLRVKMFEKLSKENSMGRVEPGLGQDSFTPDVDWVSELVE
ncbi:hypothetical protein ACFE04_015099 [Oxalis oulophora]